MLNVIMSTQQLDQFAGVFGVIPNKHEETTFFPMERFAEKKSSFAQTEEHAYIFELVAYVEIKGEISRVDFSINTDFNFPDDERHKLESLLKEDILRVINAETSVDSYSEEEINAYIDEHFFFWADAEESYRFHPTYWKARKTVNFEFRNTHYTNPEMTLNISVRTTETNVKIRTEDIDKNIENMIELLCKKGMPTDPEQLASILKEFALDEDMYLGPMSDEQKLHLLSDSVLHVTLVTKGLDNEKPNAAMTGAFSFRYKDGRVFHFDYEHAKVLQGFEMDGSFHMSFRLTGLHKDFILEANEVLPRSWNEVFEGELEEVSYEVLDEFDLPVRCEVTEFTLLDGWREWHMVPYEVLDKVNSKQSEPIK